MNNIYEKSHNNNKGILQVRNTGVFCFHVVYSLKKGRAL